MSEIAVVAISVAKPGYEEQLRQALEGIVGPTRKEPGALQYDLHRDVQEPRRFVFVERWESQETLAAHAKSAHIAASGRQWRIGSNARKFASCRRSPEPSDSDSGEPHKAIDAHGRSRLAFQSQFS